MDDLISRQAAIDALDTGLWGVEWDKALATAMLKDLPSAQPAVDVLEKIRAGIKAKIVKRPWLDFEDRERDRNDAFLEVLDIIDKYKAESEVK